MFSVSRVKPIKRGALKKKEKNKASELVVRGNPKKKCQVVDQSSNNSDKIWTYIK